MNKETNQVGDVGLFYDNNKDFASIGVLTDIEESALYQYNSTDLSRYRYFEPIPYLNTDQAKQEIYKALNYEPNK